MRARREGEAVEGEVFVDGGNALDGPIGMVQIDYARATEQNESIRELSRSLSEYAEGIEPIDPENATLVQSAHALRQLLETVYGRRITLRGENRERSGAKVDVEITAVQVDGYVAAVRAKRVGNVDVSARMRVDTVNAGGETVGLDVDDLG
ncbi:hypothetical protein CLM62_23910 [Streptomyces sp. SA15]|nr:hypothetical protein CLM62_23910 [Streptomyces sp. SA15]